MKGIDEERPYKVQEIAKRLGFSRKTIVRLFENEPGVIVLTMAKRGRRTYRTIRVPPEVLQRVLKRITR